MSITDVTAPPTHAVAPAPTAETVETVQRRTLRLLFVSQVTGGIGVSVGMSVGALLAADLASIGVSGLAQSAAVMGAVDLAPRDLYSRHLSLIVWASTVGGVLGPNLSSVAGTTLGRYGIPTLAAPFVLSIVLFTLVATLLFVWLRPDPLRVARSAALGNKTTPKPNSNSGMRVALAAVLANHDARLGVAAAAAGHIVMVGVMAMTPVHIRSGGHAPADTLRIVGVVLSLHIAGMYAFAPLMGWLADRLGRRQVILGGIALLIAACAVAGTAGHNSTRLATGLVLLGLGWSATMVAGSSLLSQSIHAELRPSAQGLSDLVMGISGASAGAVSGVVVQAFGYPTLTLVAALVTAPLAALALAYRPAR